MNLFIFNSKTKKPIPRIILFLVLLFLSDRFLFFLISSIESRLLVDHSFKKNFIDYSKNKNFNTIILGTSRTLEGIHPVYFSSLLNQNAYKEAQFGKGPKYNYLFYKFYKKHCGVPKVLIYGMDYFMFNLDSRIRWLHRFNHQENKDYFGNFLMLLKYKKNIDDFTDIMLEKLKQGLGESGNLVPLRDFVKIQKYRGVDFEKIRIDSERPDRFKHFRYHKFPGVEGDYFLKLLEECQKDEVKVILVFIPNYYGTNVTNIQRQLFYEDIHKIVKPFDNINIYNYNKIKKFPLKNREYFLNGGYGLTNSHLSKKGAALFNRKFLKDIKHHYD